MSDEPVETGLPAEGPAPDIGQGEPEAAPSPEYLDPDTYGGHHVRLRVDGEDVEVPLSEALAGYSRQADYTRKTQELADLQRQAQFGMTLQQALEANPAETLRILQGQYTQPEQEPEAEPNWTDDPGEHWRRDIESRFQRFEQQQADTELRQAIGVLQQRYGDEFSPTEVVQQAFAQGRMDLEGVYKEMAFDRYWKGQQAARETKAAEEATRLSAKDQTSNLHSGNGANNAVAPTSDQPMSIEEAFEAAKREHGWT